MSNINAFWYYNPLSPILLVDNVYKHAKDISPGDVLGHGMTVTHVIAVKTDNAPFCHINGAIVSPNLPVYINQWNLAQDVSDVIVEDCEYVYNFVLDNGGSISNRAKYYGRDFFIKSGNVKTAALTHGIFSDSALAHTYLGTRKILWDLKKKTGYDGGRVTIADTDIALDDDGNVVGIFDGEL